jgi:hypothetical protein
MGRAMSAGQIVEHASHTGLLERHGSFDDLYSSQSATTLEPVG